MVDLITSPHNLKVKAALKLSERRERNQTGLFLIEGYREIKRAVACGINIQKVFICPPLFLGENEQELIQCMQQRGTEVLTCAEHVFDKLSYRDRPDGLLCIAVQMRADLSSLTEKIAHTPHPFLIVAEAIEKPGNLGTILRSADAAGVDGVIVCDRCTDIYNPNVVRASVGTLFTLPVVEAEGEETREWLKERGIRIVAATPSATEEFTQAELKGPLAIAVGTEQLGLSQSWLEAADICVRIPMYGQADSLNVATATTLLLYEVVRQRVMCGYHLCR